MAELEEKIINELASNGPEQGSLLVRRLSEQGVQAGDARAVVWRLLDRGSVQLNWDRQLYVPRTH